MKPAWLRAQKMPLLYRFVLWVTWCLFKVFYRHKVYGHEHYFAGSGIIASNHISFLDPPIIAISWPEEIHFLARDTLFNNRFFGAFIRNLNSHPVSGDASDIAVFRTIARILENQEKILLFPEGERSFDNQLQPMKSGTALLSLRYQAKIIPAYISGAYEAWPRGKKFPKLFAKTICVFGSPIDPQAFIHLDKKEAQKKLSEALAFRIIALKQWLEKGAIGHTP